MRNRDSKALLRKAIATFCVALVLVFNGAAASAAVNQIQHMPGAPEEHQHVMFSNLVVEDHHDDQHNDADHHEAVQNHDHEVAPVQDHHDHEAPADTASKSLTGDNHHHHGDIGSSLVILAASATGPVQLWDRDIQLSADSVRISVRRSLPERPPRTSLINV